MLLFTVRMDCMWYWDEVVFFVQHEGLARQSTGMEMCNGYSEEDIRRRRVHDYTLASLPLTATRIRKEEMKGRERKAGSNCVETK